MVKIKYIFYLFVMAFMFVILKPNDVHAYFEQNGVFYGSFHYEQQMTDFYSLYPEVKYHEGLPYIWEEGGRYYFGGDLSYLVANRFDYYGDVQPLITLNNSGWSSFEPGDEWVFATSTEQYKVPLASQMAINLLGIRFINNGVAVKYFGQSQLNNSGATFQKNYGYDPDYYIGLEEGYNNGYVDGQKYGEFLHKDDYVNGFNAGESAGYLTGYDDGFVDGFESTSDGGMWGVLWTAILAPFTILNTEMLPGITLAMIVAVPLVFGLLGWILSTGKSRK